MVGTELIERGAQPAPSTLQASLPEVVTVFSFALDAAEGREPGHAAKLTYVASLLAARQELPADVRRTVLYASLMHDIGVPAAATGLAGLSGVDEELLFGFSPINDMDAAEVPIDQRRHAARVLNDHVTAGVSFLQEPWFPRGTAAAVRHRHENWDGSGYPLGASGEEILAASRLIRAGDLFECIVSAETNPLTARARSCRTVANWSGRELQPEIASALLDLVDDDVFWLGFYDDVLASKLVETASTDATPSGTLLWEFSQAVAGLADAKSGHEPGRSQRVARYVTAMAEGLGMDDEQVALLTLLSLWNDVGAFSVPNRILIKPDLLSLEEMQRMRAHPAFSAELVERIDVLRPGARWIAAHHERVDGRGYPEMLSGPAIASEAGILGLADAYVALTARRPYRDAHTREDATAVLAAGSGSQWDPFLVQIFLELLEGEQDQNDLLAAGA